MVWVVSQKRPKNQLGLLTPHVLQLSEEIRTAEIAFEATRATTCRIGSRPLPTRAMNVDY